MYVGSIIIKFIPTICMYISMQIALQCTMYIQGQEPQSLAGFEPMNFCPRGVFDCNQPRQHGLNI
jgi:hypothetical protein